MRFCRRSSSFLAFYQFVAVFLVLPMRRILVFSNTSVSPVVAVYERLIKTRCQGAAILQNSIVMSFLKYRSGFIWVPIKMSLLTRYINKCILSNWYNGTLSRHSAPGHIHNVSPACWGAVFKAICIFPVSYNDDYCDSLNLVFTPKICVIIDFVFSSLQS